MAKGRKQQHVVPHGDGWGVRRSGASRVTKQHRTQREAIDHAKAADVPVVVAINKCDRPNAEPDRVRQELVQYDLQDEQWGG